MTKGITFLDAALWSALWLAFMLLYTAVGMLLRRALPEKPAAVLRLGIMAACAAAFVLCLQRHTPFELKPLANLSLPAATLGILCAPALYLLLDRGLDPLLERAFPRSEAAYRDALNRLARAPVTSLLHLCVLAPIVEELLIRGFILAGLRLQYGPLPALLVSALIFAVLHFNLVQTLSALIAGLALGLLYLGTGSVAACVLAHCGYNLVSYVKGIRPDI